MLPCGSIATGKLKGVHDWKAASGNVVERDRDLQNHLRHRIDGNGGGVVVLPIQKSIFTHNNLVIFVGNWIYQLIFYG